MIAPFVFAMVVPLFVVVMLSIVMIGACFPGVVTVIGLLQSGYCFE